VNISTLIFYKLQVCGYYFFLLFQKFSFLSYWNNGSHRLFIISLTENRSLYRSMD
jgi:hypothetical protein